VKKNEKNISVGETSGQGIVWSGNCPVGNRPVRELSLEEMSGQGIVRIP